MGRLVLVVSLVLCSSTLRRALNATAPLATMAAPIYSTLQIRHVPRSVHKPAKLEKATQRGPSPTSCIAELHLREFDDLRDGVRVLPARFTAGDVSFEVGGERPVRFVASRWYWSNRPKSPPFERSLPTSDQV